MGDRASRGVQVTDLVVASLAVGAGGAVSAWGRWPRALGTVAAFGTAALVLSLGRRLTAGWAASASVATRLARRVLVADDDAVNRRLVESVVRNLGWHVDTVATGRAAVEAARTTPYDLILMDCAMPELDGFDATREIRAAEGATRVPIVALTADDDAGVRERCLDAGMDDHVAKPIEPERLRARLELWVLPIEASSDIVDGRVLAALDAFAAERDASLVDDLVDAFLRTTADTCGAIQRAIASRDLDGLRREAHRLKGGAGTVGARRLAAMCGALEALGREGRLVDVGALVGRIEHETRQVSALLAARTTPARKGKAA